MLFEDSYKEVLCPAKINLYLKVGAKRKDGYHEIGSLMAKLEWGDSLDMEIGQSSQTKIDFHCSDESIPQKDNLVYKAAHEFSQALPVYFEAQIKLRKKIPHGTGLAGGSSDAAQCLMLLKNWYLKRIGKHPKIDRIIDRIAANLGSDLHVFLETQSNAAWCYGRGDKTKALNIPTQHVLLVLSPIRVSTVDAYKWLSSLRRKTKPSSTDSPAWIRELNQLDVFPLENDFQEIVFGRHSELGEALRQLAIHGAKSGAMTGSGSCVFGLFESDETLGKAHLEMTKLGFDCVKTRLQKPGSSST